MALSITPTCAFATARSALAAVTLAASAASSKRTSTSPALTWSPIVTSTALTRCAEPSPSRVGTADRLAGVVAVTVKPAFRLTRGTASVGACAVTTSVFTRPVEVIVVDGAAQPVSVSARAVAAAGSTNRVNMGSARRPGCAGRRRPATRRRHVPAAGAGR